VRMLEPISKFVDDVLAQERKRRKENARCR